MYKKILYIFLGLDLLAVNAATFYLLNHRITAADSYQVNDQRAVSDQSGATCLDDCRQYTDEKISQLEEAKTAEETTRMPTSTPTSTPTTKKTAVKSVSYIPIPGSGSTLETEWTTLSGTDFYISKGDYQGLTGVYFEANMKLVNGNGKGYLRIYDATHDVAVDGSTVETDSQTSVAVGSGSINLWDGYNKYQVQAKSLTADTTVFESGRLKVITQN
jgi:hypothetical protein